MNNSKPTVLIVDDDVNTVSMLNDALDEAGFTVLVALEGQQAISVTQKITPDIILLDAVMPNIDGFEASKRLRENPALKHTPILFMTGLSDLRHIIDAFDSGVVDYMTKPIRVEELIVRMRTHLHNSRMTVSAYNAMDYVGQTLCLFNLHGQLLWATPNAWELLKECCDSEYNPRPAFVSRVTAWLAVTGAPKFPLDMSALSISLKFYFSRKVSENEYLLRIEPIREHHEKDLIEVLKFHFSLTLREAEVLLWIARGKSNREIGEILELSPRTVNKHLETIFPKLGVDNRTVAAVITATLLHKQNHHYS